MPWLSAAAALALVALLAAFALWEPRLHRAWLFLVPLVLFLPDRSLANYLTDFVPAALVAALTVASVDPVGRPAAGRAAVRPWRPRLSVALPALASAALVVVAFTSAPLAVTVDRVAAAGVATVDGGLSCVRVDVTVHNTSDHAVAAALHGVLGRGAPDRLLVGHAVAGGGPRCAPGATHGVRPAADPLHLGAPATGSGGWWRPTRPRPTPCLRRRCSSGRSGDVGTDRRARPGAGGRPAARPPRPGMRPAARRRSWPASRVHPCSCSSWSPPDGHPLERGPPQHRRRRRRPTASRPAAGRAPAPATASTGHRPHQVVLPGDGRHHHARRGAHQDPEERRRVPPAPSRASAMPATRTTAPGRRRRRPADTTWWASRSTAPRRLWLRMKYAGRPPGGVGGVLGPVVPRRGRVDDQRPPGRHRRTTASAVHAARTWRVTKR